MTLAADALVVATGLFVALAVATFGRAVLGPTVQDRVVAVNAVGTLTVVVIALSAAAFDEPGFVDVAIVYALLNFLLSLGVSRVLVGRGGVRS
jgi:multicomponent Na+:H+ antiporter subunit F